MQPPRFLADAMLERLARWLRVLGFDTLYAPHPDDRELVALAASEDRLLLTRDRHLLRELRPQRALEMLSDEPLAQLAQVLAACEIVRAGPLFTRCLECNAELIAVRESEAAALVPPRSRAMGGPVRRCPTCERLYWHGSHTRRMEAALRKALPSLFAGTNDPLNLYD